MIQSCKKSTEEIHVRVTTSLQDVYSSDPITVFHSSFINLSHYFVTACHVGINTVELWFQVSFSLKKLQ